MERIHVKVPGEQPQDREYMKQALALAEKGHGWVNPNPMVGAVLLILDRRQSPLRADRDHRLKRVI